MAGARGRSSGRQQRGQRILDAAAELVLRWGYDKTTLDDVARAAGVAKGTIYLHWKNRERLFVALLRRERVELLTEVRRRVTEGSEGPSLRSLLVHMTLVYLRRPLLRAVVTRDLDVIGKLASAEKAVRAGSALRSDFVRYLEMLRESGLVRVDLGLAEQVQVVSAAFLGFFLAPPMVPDEFAVSDEVRAELLAEVVCRSLAAGGEFTSAESERLAVTTVRYLDEALANAEATYRDLLDSEG
ncbi:TetR/AcrR family transcriptional regulator [Saccharopolyspora sp. K220]|uniref:TetR/AcrR family transcriptional regulator n=1 Tax=Saccharopolyspora soli TaxID=2926618 RepID=UPI001F59F8E0|nr:TetR/AcrR family transcriptional regulator [Saccharopolyspora soli]MCI2421057.1 TetR/AcrR family transcriptional regulator [Saccharopolyspora soli]